MPCIEENVDYHSFSRCTFCWPCNFRNGTQDFGIIICTHSQPSTIFVITKCIPGTDLSGFFLSLLSISCFYFLSILSPIAFLESPSSNLFTTVHRIGENEMFSDLADFKEAKNMPLIMISWPCCQQNVAKSTDIYDGTSGKSFIIIVYTSPSPEHFSSCKEVDYRKWHLKINQWRYPS